MPRGTQRRKEKISVFSVVFLCLLWFTLLLYPRHYDPMT